MQWPMSSLCKSCKNADTTFRMKHVYRFLNSFYKGDGAGDECSQFISPTKCLSHAGCELNKRYCFCEQKRKDPLAPSKSLTKNLKRFVQKTNAILSPNMMFTHLDSELELGANNRRMPHSCHSKTSN